MKVSDVMTRDVEVVRPDATLQEAAEKMKALDIGPLPVSDGRQLVGMVTDRDITVRATAEGKDPRTTPVREVMTDRVISCYADDDVREAADRMQKEQIRRLVVLDRAKNVVGVVSLGDLATSGASRKVTSKALEEISEPGGGFGGGTVGLLALVVLLGAVVLAALGGGETSSGGSGSGTAGGA